MRVEMITEGRTVYELVTYYDGTSRKIKVRECRTEAEAKAVANYLTIRGRVE